MTDVLSKPMIRTPLADKVAPGFQIEIPRLLDAAREKTGLDDFGDDWFLEPLEALIHYVNTEAALPHGDVQPVQHLITMLSDRLRLNALLRERPEIADEPIDVGGFIANQPRGGSTLSQRLFARSPQTTSCYYWETMAPLPLKGEEPGHPAQRLANAEQRIRDILAARPELASMHPMKTHEYESDVILLDRSFMSYNYVLEFNVPSYFDWLVEQDQTRAMHEFKTWLQVLQYFDPSRRGKKWILKNSSNTLTNQIPAMFETFPDAVCIQTHRNMTTGIPSLASIQANYIRVSQSTTFDQKDLGPRLIHHFKTGIGKMMDLREQRQDRRWLDVRYKDLVADPIGQFRRVIEGIGLVCGPDDIQAATDWMNANQRDTHPAHKYSPEEFGVTDEQLKREFADYHATYGI